jgi:hypothetical protein
VAGSQIDAAPLSSREKLTPDSTFCRWLRFAAGAAHLPDFSQWPQAVQQGCGTAKQAAQGPPASAATSSSTIDDMVTPRTTTLGS